MQLTEANSLTGGPTKPGSTIWGAVRPLGTPPSLPYPLRFPVAPCPTQYPLTSSPTDSPTKEFKRPTCQRLKAGNPTYQSALSDTWSSPAAPGLVRYKPFLLRLSLPTFVSSLSLAAGLELDTTRCDDDFGPWVRRALLINPRLNLA
jgi:hypothetical protein